MEGECTPLFIYGTLRRGCRASYLMDGAVYLGTAELHGHLLYIDRYPGLILGGESKVVGEVYLVNSDHLGRLDRYEGCYETPPEYLREQVVVIDEEGLEKEVATYVFNHIKPHHRPLGYLDWCDFISDNPELNSETN